MDRTFLATVPNLLWVADLGYAPAVQGRRYLTCVTDVPSRVVLGWSMASDRKTRLVVDAPANRLRAVVAHRPDRLVRVT